MRENYKNTTYIIWIRRLEDTENLQKFIVGKKPDLAKN